MFPNSWIAATGQRWKLLVMLLLGGLTSILLVTVVFFSSRMSERMDILLLLAFPASFLLFLPWMFFAFRICSNEIYRLVWCPT